MMDTLANTVHVILPGSIETSIQERTYQRNLDRIAYPIAMPSHFPPLHGRRGELESESAATRIAPRTLGEQLAALMPWRSADTSDIVDAPIVVEQIDPVAARAV